MLRKLPAPQASGMYAGATYAAVGIGALGFIVGLWNAQMALNEKGYYFTLLAFGLFAVVSLQKNVRDKAEGLPVSGSYSAICYVATALSMGLLCVGLWNATLLLSEKGYYLMAFCLALFASVTVQKNVRDSQAVSATPSADRAE